MNRMIALLLFLVAAPAVSAQPLQAVFANPEPELCRSIYIASMMPIFERPAYDFENRQIIPDVYEIRFGANRGTEIVYTGERYVNQTYQPRTIAVVTGIENANTLLLELFIRINGLNLTPDDFRDAVTGEYVCTNEKLFSLT